MRPEGMWLRARARFEAEPALTLLGCAGVLLALGCLGGVAVYGPVRAPEGKLLDAASFDLGVGVFLLTIALVLPLAGFSERRHRLLRRLFLAFGTYGMALETLQSFRGLDPRFSPLHGIADAVAGALFGVNALLLTLAFLVMGAQLFRAHVLRERPVLRLALRYGSIAVGFSFAVGIVMSVNQGREVGVAGDLLPAHGLGVHGLQALPILALVLLWGGVPRAGSWIHLAGTAWLVAVVAALVQALSGRPPLEMSAPLLVAVGGLSVWVSAALRALLAATRARPLPALVLQRGGSPPRHGPTGRTPR